MKRIEVCDRFEDGARSFLGGVFPQRINLILADYLPRCRLCSTEMYGTDSRKYYRLDVRTDFPLMLEDSLRGDIEKDTIESSFDSDGTLAVVQGEILDAFYKAYEGGLRFHNDVWNPIIDTQRFLRVKFSESSIEEIPKVGLRLTVYGFRAGDFYKNVFLINDDVLDDEELKSVFVNIGELKPKYTCGEDGKPEEEHVLGAIFAPADPF